MTTLRESSWKVFLNSSTYRLKIKNGTSEDMPLFYLFTLILFLS